MPDKKEPRGNSATRRRANPVTGCPLTAALAAIGGKWKMIIIYWLAEEPTHFAGLHRKMESISRKVLTQQLRELGADGIVDRCAAGRLSEPVFYSLTHTAAHCFRWSKPLGCGVARTWNDIGRSSRGVRAFRAVWISRRSESRAVRDPAPFMSCAL